jgi:hypothetical protein
VDEIFIRDCDVGDEIMSVDDAKNKRLVDLGLGETFDLFKYAFQFNAFVSAVISRESEGKKNFDVLWEILGLQLFCFHWKRFLSLARVCVSACSFTF